ncbi:unnamed protein product [Tenebrio molitor]|nr:unnamed protein product [Tenebrio molitor]
MIATSGHQDQCIRIHKKLSPSCQVMSFSITYDQLYMQFVEVLCEMCWSPRKIQRRH